MGKVDKCPQKLIRTAAQDQNERKRAKMFVSNREKRDERWSLNSECKCFIHAAVK